MQSIPKVIVRADSGYDGWDNPWLLVIEPCTTTRARVRDMTHLEIAEGL